MTKVRFYEKRKMLKNLSKLIFTQELLRRTLVLVKISKQKSCFFRSGTFPCRHCRKRCRWIVGALLDRGDPWAHHPAHEQESLQDDGADEPATSSQWFGSGPVDMVSWFTFVLKKSEKNFLYICQKNWGHVILLTKMMLSGYPVFEDIVVSTEICYILYMVPGILYIL